MTSMLFSLDHVGYRTPDREILTDISFNVDAGEYITISGPSGSGKSTLLRLLATLLTPTSGQITYHDQPQSSYPKTTYRQAVSYCFQQPSLFGDTVQDNLAFPFELRNQPFDAAKAQAALAQVDLPTSMLTKPITELSGGEKQRVALIRNLLFEPDVILLDEVTTGLDAATKTIVHELIEGLNQKGLTVLAVTHDETEINVAHRLLTITAGRLEAAQ
ncbi:MAG: ATP-binding cassette domain-containing protein [Lactobacillus sp.]|jgi:putative ABC transport system ATP-binding protein|uniref:ATP-binding cassette domain-containing protein n=1 Tax=Lacticaseibacillus suilingensis TaxID=2799577 RepID=A0ABW4BDA6_9LACO|nr:ATP-binding cassette domain-containing protein [Lacticaseibacillus suilingensis]MCI1893488.1 ATP-binding cassette domain-containing protein [Lactobacillus sp.]MCI1941005.1 ATP-binding cassette domain-containing protein [Lactobacillus sp.]MCI1971522.1 ATP-binding cassette domain-containing protein [Lactobacillus sp.]MCI2016019.1 ATP-binding cassette domain-containing protein [Lactobacillus sp.]MCI2036587.1 ATP-binding cassette domain-containing protein [Lactobacillus sp.]